MTPMSIVLTTVVGIVSIPLMVDLTEYHTTVTIRYDCRLLMGGWHPDVPPAVQQQCRKLKGN